MMGEQIGRADAGILSYTATLRGRRPGVLGPTLTGKVFAAHPPGCGVRGQDDLEPEAAPTGRDPCDHGLADLGDYLIPLRGREL